MGVCVRARSNREIAMCISGPVRSPGVEPLRLANGHTFTRSHLTSLADHLPRNGNGLDRRARGVRFGAVADNASRLPRPCTAGTTLLRGYACITTRLLVSVRLPVPPCRHHV